MSKRQAKPKNSSRKTEEERKEERKAKAREAQLRLLVDDDGKESGVEISTQFTYVDIPVGKSLIGEYVDLLEMPSDFSETGKTLRPVLLVGEESVMLKAHNQLITGLRQVKRGSKVKITCIDMVDVEGFDNPVPQYRIEKL